MEQGSGSGRPVVAIVGRPNVGKSALFNRIAGRRLAIVHSESGVTRDRLIREVEWEGRRFDLVDTGGVCDADGAVERDAIAAGIRRQAEAALADAQAVVLVTDLQAGLTPLDEVAASLVRRKGRRFIVAANKADSPEHEDLAQDFARLGGSVFPVSAIHNRGVGELLEAVLRDLPEAVAAEAATVTRVAVVGRPNVGKSSFINRLLRAERVIVSDRPGTTRDSIDIPFAIGRGPSARRYVLVDTAGMRPATRIDTVVERFGLMRAQRAVSACDVAVLVLDARQGPTAHDKRIADMINRRRRGCVLLVNKWDLQPETQRTCSRALAGAMPFMTHCPVVFTSATTGYNIRQAIEAVDVVAGQMQAHLPTGVLNRVLADATRRTQAPSSGGRMLKIFYAAQVGTNPPRVRLFVNRPRQLVPEYRTYLVHALRTAFGLEGAPVVIEAVARARKNSSE